MSSGTGAAAAPRPGWRARLAGAGLELDALTMTFSGGVTAVLGLGFWTVAARGYSMAEVGRASAIIYAATVLATLANLSLGGMYERFLPVSGDRTRRYLLAGTGLSAGLALLLGSGFWLFGPTERLFAAQWELLGFPLLVLCLAQFALLDHTLVGLGRTRWAAGKNIVHAVAKLVLAAAAIGWAASGFSLVTAWAAPAGLLVLVYLPVLWRRWSVGGSQDLPAALPPRAELWSFFGTSFGIMVVAAIAPLVIPLIVVQQLGVELNAAFTMAWALYSAAVLLLTSVTGPYVARAATPGSAVGRLTRRFAALLAGLTLLGAVFLWFLGPVLLGLLGPRYAAEAGSLMRLMALSLPLSYAALLFAGVARVVRRLRLAMAMQLFLAVAVVTGTWLTVPRFGLDGIGYTYLAAEALVTVVLAGPIWRTIRRLG